jgi:uncharacterized protein YaaR (DUF327 family)
MVKIGEGLGQSNTVGGLSPLDEKRVREARTDSFQARLIKIEGDTQEERIRNLAQAIFEQGEKLGKKVDIRELKKYKQLISTFLEEAVGTSCKFSKESFLDRRGRYRIYASIKKINEEIEELTRQVLSSEKDNIQILQKLDDIRGLIMDIFM